MWLIFIVTFIAIALAGLVVVWIGSKIFRSIEREDRISDVESEAYDQVKKKIKMTMEDQDVK